MKTYIVGICGHGWTWGETVEATSEEEAESKVSELLGKNEIVIYVRLK